MTDCILEAINSSRQAFISGLTGRLFPLISRRLGHGSSQGAASRSKYHPSEVGKVSAIFWTTEAALQAARLSSRETEHVQAPVIPHLYPSPAPPPVLACPAWSWRALAFSAGGDGGRRPA